MESNLLHKLSRELDIPEDKILDESIHSFLENELRNAYAEIMKIKTAFDVSSHGELKRKIKQGEIEDHPAWEQLIYWENMNKRVKVVDSWIQKLHISG